MPILSPLETGPFILLQATPAGKNCIPWTRTAAETLSGVLDSTGPGREQYLINSLMEEAIAGSSQLEGAATSRQVAKQMLCSRRKPRKRDERMIVTSYLTMKAVRSAQQKNPSPRISSCACIP